MKRTDNISAQRSFAVRHRQDAYLAGQMSPTESMLLCRRIPSRLHEPGQDTCLAVEVSTDKSAYLAVQVRTDKIDVKL